MKKTYLNPEEKEDLIDMFDESKAPYIQQKHELQVKLSSVDYQMNTDPEIKKEDEAMLKELELKVSSIDQAKSSFENQYNPKEEEPQDTFDLFLLKRENKGKIWIQ